MNYLALLKGFCKEAVDLKQYKKLGNPWRILAFIALLPFIVLAVYTMISFVVIGFFYNALESSVKFLETWLKEQKKGVKHATEAVMYAICMPWIFFCMALLSSFAMIFYFQWFFLQIFGFVSTLGGTSWQPFISYASYDDSKTWTVTTNRKNGIVLSLILFISYFLCMVFCAIGGAVDEGWFIAAGVFALVNYAATVSIPLVFKKTSVGVVTTSTDSNDDISGDGLGDYIPEL